MFCQKCGNQVDGNASFCPYCSNPISGEQSNYRVSSVQMRQQTRQDEIGELDKMIRYFSQKQAQYDEYDAVCARLDPYYLRKRPSLIIWGLVSGFWGVMFLINRFIPLGIILLLGAGALIFAFIKSTQARTRNYAEASRRYYELSEELYQYYCNYGPCLVSASYSNPSNLAAIKQTIQSGRADTIADALNILLDDEHKAAMEAYASKTLSSAQEAARAAGNAASSANAAAVFSAANFFYTVQKDRV